MAATNQPPSFVQSKQVKNKITVSGSHCYVAGGDINYHHHSLRPGPVTSFRLIDKPVPHFTGREKLIKNIHKLLTKCATKTNYTERIVVLRGFGGMGKSESARKYVETHINDPIIKNVAWIDAETKDSTKESFTTLAETLNLELKSSNTEHIAQTFYRHFSNNIKTGLIIFDNVEQLRDQSPYHGILNYLPTQLLDYVPLILITSRLNDWDIPLERKYVIEVSGLSEDASVTYLYKNIKIQENASVTEAFHRLAKAVEGYPLGLTLAASTIRSHGSERIKTVVENYITRLDTSKQDWVKDELSGGAATNYKLLMSAVWDATIGKIKLVEKDSTFALELLGIMAYFPADDILRYEILKLYEGVLERTVSDFERGMHILNTYSLASTWNNYWGKNYVRIHRHVQRCAQTMHELKNDYSYLGIVACLRCTHTADAKSIKKSLELWPWSRKAIREFILVFSNVIDYEIACEMKMCLNKVFTEPSYIKENDMIHYYATFHYLCDLESDMHTMEVLEFDEKAETAFLLAAQAFFGLVDVPVVQHKEENIIVLALSSLWKRMYFKHNLLSRLKDHLRSKIGVILLAFSNKSVSECYDDFSVARIYNYFEFYYKDNTCEESQKYVAAAIKCYNKYHKITGWEFPLRRLSKFFDAENSKWRSEHQAIVNTFFDEGGTTIIVEILRNGSHYFPDCIEMLQFVILMTRYPGCSQKLVLAENFLDNLIKLTDRRIRGSYFWIHYPRYVLLLLWFGLFSSSRTMRDSSGKEWTIKSISEEMNLFMNEYKKEPKYLVMDIRKSQKYFKVKALESILNPYITSTAGVHDELTVETANLMHHAYLSSKS